MKIKTYHAFSPYDLDYFDITIPLVIRGISFVGFRQANIKNGDILRNVIRANNVVGKFLRSI